MQLIHKNKNWIQLGFLLILFLAFQLWQSNRFEQKQLEILEVLTSISDSTRIQLCEVEPLVIKKSDYYKIYEGNLYTQITNNFIGKEYVKFNDPEINIFRGDTFQVHRNIAAAVQLLRIEYGVPIVINSAQRSLTKQLLINPTAPNSDHIHGNAVDIAFLYDFERLSNDFRAALIKETDLRLAMVNGLKVTQVIFYDRHIHVGLGDPNRGEIDCGGVFLDVINKRKSLVDFVE